MSMSIARKLKGLMVIIFIKFILTFILAATLMNCPRQNVKYEKTIGIRPSDNNGLLLYQNKDNKPITNECLTRCLENPNCLSFVLFYNKSLCYMYNVNLDEIREKDIVIDGSAAWFTKICVYRKF